VVRKVQTSPILKAELQAVERAMNKYSDVEHFKVYPKKNTIEIHIATRSNGFVPIAVDPVAVLISMATKGIAQGLLKQLEEQVGGKAALNKLRKQTKKEKEAARKVAFLKLLQYTPELRFVLEDPKERIFVAERMCYRSDADWMMIGYAGKVEELAKELVVHLDKKSFFDLY